MTNKYNTFFYLLISCILIESFKQGLVQDYSQRIEGANISGLKLSRSPGFENFNDNNPLLNYNNGLKA